MNIPWNTYGETRVAGDMEREGDGGTVVHLFSSSHSCWIIASGSCVRTQGRTGGAEGSQAVLRRLTDKTRLCTSE